MSSEMFDDEIQNPPKPVPFSDVEKERFITVYTIFSFLMKIKTHLGLEAMLEYVEGYMKEIEESCPEMKNAVTQAMGMMNRKN
ncbi:MAG: hypothetical protein HQL24_07320 [Candidatus Omnitrophica bacterium]|nr:hypothetical protein [Candidatus Omnitrophota bacterium]